MHYPKYTALHMAAFHNNLEDVKQLCTPENVNNTADDRQYITPLYCVALNDKNIEIKKQIIVWLLGNGGNINAINKQGDSVLFVAALAGKQEVVEFLLLKGAKIDKDRLKSSTAYLEKRYPKILRLLENPDIVKQQSNYSWPKSGDNSIKQRTSRSYNTNELEMTTMVSSLK